MKIIIAGAGRLGRQAAHLLTAVGHQVTVIERNRTRLADLDGDHLHRLVRGDACEPTVLESAGALTSDLLLASTGDDEDNLVIALLAKRQFSVPRVLARVNDPDNAWLFDRRWGVDVPVSATAPMVSLIEEAAGAADTIGLVKLASAGVTLIETHIESTSSAAGRPIADVSLPAGTVVAAVIRDGRPTVPGDDFRFRTGDSVLIVTTSATEADVHRAFQQDRQRA